MFDPFQAPRREMVADQLLARGITSPAVLHALSQVPREKFVLPELTGRAYADQALPILCGQTISQPYMVGLMTETLELKGTEKVLEVGTGSGYQAAVLSQLAAEVISIERHEELSRQAAAVLAELGCTNVQLVVGDGTQGYSPEAPYERIIVTAGAESCPPALLSQLAERGLLVMPIGPGNRQMLQAIRKQDGETTAVDVCACRFVPLVSGEG